MKLYVISFTTRGRQLADRVKALLIHHDVTLFQGQGQEKITLMQFAQRGYEEAEGLIFISSTGIAVRAIAPVLQQRLKDPAVVVIDDDGKFAISLISGLWAGANQLTKELATGLGGTAVVTTSTDRYNQFAIDTYAREHGFTLVNSYKVQELKRQLILKKPLQVYSAFPVTHLVEGLELVEDINQAQLVFDSKPHPSALTLIPQDYVLGIGCNQEIDPDDLLDFAEITLSEQGISLMSIRAITSDDETLGGKAMEFLSQEWEIPYTTFAVDELEEMEGDFTPIDYALDEVATDNLCERSAVALGGNLVMRKVIHNGYTLALAKQDRVIAIGELKKS